MIIFLVFCVSSAAESSCWFWTPVNENHTGFIGSASRFSIEPRGSQIASRKQALLRFSEFFNLNVSAIKNTELLKNELHIENWSIRFSEPYETDDTLYMLRFS